MNWLKQITDFIKSVSFLLSQIIILKLDLNNEFETGQECIKCFECIKGCPATNINLAINSKKEK